MTSTTEPLEEQYFVWLYQNYVNENIGEPISHWSLCAYLHHIPYRWTVPNDANRAEDGKFLRETFLSEGERDVTHEFLTQDCSVFEFLIALSERGEFESAYGQKWWFFEMIHNLGLLDLNDQEYPWFPGREDLRVDRRIKTYLDREYDYDGEGGMFPLRNPPQDQRTAEVWYQLSSYILEMS